MNLTKMSEVANVLVIVHHNSFVHVCTLLNKKICTIHFLHMRLLSATQQKKSKHDLKFETKITEA